MCTWPLGKLYVTFSGFGAKRWKSGTSLANVKTNNLISFQQRATKKVHTGTNWHRTASVIQYSPFHWKPSVVSGWGQKEWRKINTIWNLNHTRNKKYELKDCRVVFLWVTLNFIKIVRKIVCIAMLCDLNAKVLFCFYIDIRTSHISSVYVYINYTYIKSRFGASQNKYFGNSC